MSSAKKVKPGLETAKGIGFASICCLSWGLNDLVTRSYVGIGEGNIYLFNSISGFFTAFFLWLVFLSSEPKKTLAQAPEIFFYAGFWKMNASRTVSFFFVAYFLTFSSAGLLQVVYLFVPAMVLLLNKDAPRNKLLFWVGLIMSLAGVFAFFYTQGEIGYDNDVPGAITAGFFVVLFVALTNVTSSKAGRGMPDFYGRSLLLFLGYFVTGVIFLILVGLIESKLEITKDVVESAALRGFIAAIGTKSFIEALRFITDELVSIVGIATIPLAFFMEVLLGWSASPGLDSMFLVSVAMFGFLLMVSGVNHSRIKVRASHCQKDSIETG